MLGGIEIPHIKGLQGHSDGDALIHAICDAILGAAGLEDIGHQFPDNDDRYAGVSGVELLKKVRDLISKKRFKVDYIDSVVILEEPRIGPFKKDMAERIAASLGIDSDNVSVKAKTQEGIGALGRGEAAAAYAVTSLKKI
jgi:2-C-methyl-D-erythritol 2,4-cyclodiphosphate synthase